MQQMTPLLAEPESREILDDDGARLMRSAVTPEGRDMRLAPFRVLILNANAQLIRFFYLECASTAEAIDCARELAAGRPAEVWRNGDLVGRCAPQVERAGLVAGDEGEGHQCADGARDADDPDRDGHGRQLGSQGPVDVVLRRVG